MPFPRHSNWFFHNDIKFKCIFYFFINSFGFFIALHFSLFKPESLKLIPKPGTWMINFRFLMALFLLLTSCWLLSLLGLDTRFITIFFVSITSISLFYDFNKFKLIISGFIIFIILFLILILIK